MEEILTTMLIAVPKKQNKTKQKSVKGLMVKNIPDFGFNTPSDKQN